MKRILRFSIIATITAALIYLLFVSVIDRNKLITYSSAKSKYSYYMMWVNDNDPLRDSFLDNIRHIAKEQQIDKIYAQDMTALNQVTTLFQYQNGELVRRVRADQPIEELIAFFNEELNISEESDFGKTDYNELTLLFNEILITHLLTDNPNNVSKEDLKYNLLSFRFYMYNNEKIKENVDSKVPDLIPQYFVLKDNQGKVIPPIGKYPSINTSELLKGDRAKVMVTYLLPQEIDINDLTLHYLFKDRTIPLTDLEEYETLSENKFNF